MTEKLYARAGEEVTCENGHTICVVARDIPAGALMHDRIEKDFTGFRQLRPQYGDMPKDHLCVKCGARWFMGPTFHFRNGGWRGAPEYHTNEG
jgi:hypothetical protein